MRQKVVCPARASRGDGRVGSYRRLMRPISAPVSSSGRLQKIFLFESSVWRPALRRRIHFVCKAHLQRPRGHRQALCSSDEKRYSILTIQTTRRGKNVQPVHSKEQFNNNMHVCVTNNNSESACLPHHILQANTMKSQGWHFATGSSDEAVLQ